MHVHKLNNIQEDKTREQASSIDGFIDDMAMIFKDHFYIAKKNLLSAIETMVYEKSKADYTPQAMALFS